MATIIKVQQGIAISVYDDRLRPIYQALGIQEITRASNVEWEAEKSAWVARDPQSGDIIAYGPDRAEVIRLEVMALESKIKSGRL